MKPRSKIEKENLALKRVVHKRTLELVEKKRELEIEASLEKVRVVAMGMKQRADMTKICKTISLQLAALGVKEIRNVQTAIFYREKGSYQNYEYYAKHRKAFITDTIYTNHKIARSFAKKMMRGKGEDHITHIKGHKKVKAWLDYQKTTNVFIDNYLEHASSLNYYWHSLGPVALGISTYDPLEKNDLKLFSRFLKVFELAYRRYLDIERAEAQAREAQIEAALERVRARTMAMQKSDELQQAASLLFHQVQSLGIPAWTCGYNVWEKDDKVFTAWMSLDGKLQPPFKIPLTESPTFMRFAESRKKGEEFYVEELGGAKLNSHYKYMMQLPEFAKIAAKQIEAGFPFPKFQIHHVVNFSQGNLIFITHEPVPEAWDIFKRFGKVFDQTYTRFLDLQKAQAHAIQAELDLIEIKNAKKKAEDAYIELQTAQKQLIQSEKMASLGELTAGIAHEIQNPLNFVNNFSDVSAELLGEMTAEMRKGHNAEAMAIAEDVKENLSKILHHGKRADAIVKGMLQHSRSSSGQKEPTDLNALADEYIRLAYHGLRAKDKSFNASFNTALDPSVGEVNLIPQDIGRVLVNLLNNAFYAVNEKKKRGIKGYEPTVTISTRKKGSELEIVVSDNGVGIPEKAKEKIFQPFFTTKPTGQGTGLGLSLSYDILKAHDGDLRVVSKGTEGTEFIISLPG